MMLSSRRTTHIGRLLLMTFFVQACLSSPSMVFAWTDGDLSNIQSSFSDLQNDVQNARRRQGALEEELKHFDEKVASAKDRFQSAADRRKNIRTALQQHEDRLHHVRIALSDVRSVRGQYQATDAARPSDIAPFVRYLALQHQRTSNDFLIRTALQRSLTTSSLTLPVVYRASLQRSIAAYDQFSEHADAYIQSAITAETSLHAAATSIESSIVSLQQEREALGDTLEDTSAFIADSWKLKKLSEAELRDVQAESAEANQALANLQSHLKDVSARLEQKNITLDTQERSALLAEKKKLLEEQASLRNNRDALTEQRTEYLRAYQETVTRRNTEPKLFQKIQDREAELEQSIQTLDRGSTGAIDEQGKEVLLSFTERQKITETINQLRERIDLMKKGVPDSVAETYVRLKSGATTIDQDIAAFDTKLEGVNVSLDALAKREVALSQKEQSMKEAQALLPPTFMWPVVGRISAGFYDPEYQRVFGVPHKGIDITTAQNTVIRAASDGVVYGIKDGGRTGFSYLLIGHRNGYATLYGHVSSFLVKTGDVVVKGQAIAFSGGMPGTHGAGPMTTGPHLHLEMTKDGKHIDPRSVLE